MKKKKYRKPQIAKITIDIRQMVKNMTGCPYLFIWNGRKYVKENSLLPDSEDLFRDKKILTDHYVLQNVPRAKDGYLWFKVCELEEDISWFDSFRLIQIETPKGYKVGFTPEGKLLTYKHPLLPLECKDEIGRTYLKEINPRNFIKPPNFIEKKKGEELYLNFGKITADSAKLVIVDPPGCPNYCYGYFQCMPEGCQLFCQGECNALKTSIHVYIWMHSTWQHISVIHTRAEFYPDIIDLSNYLSEIKGDLKIKLEFTASHKVGFVGIDISHPIHLEMETYKLVQASHSELGEVTDILKENNREFIRLLPREEIILKFPTPRPYKQEKRQFYVLVSMGYYLPLAKAISDLKRINELVLLR